MYGAISNPTKSFQVSFPLEYTYHACQHIYLFNRKYHFQKRNDVLTMVTFGAFEFLDLGAFIDIQCSPIDDNKTQINIEVRRKIGSFDQSYEVTNANRHLQNVMELISTSLSTDANVRYNTVKQQQLKEQESKTTDTTSSSGLGFFGWVGLMGLVFFIIKLMMN
jgi:hypothetical protein